MADSGTLLIKIKADLAGAKDVKGMLDVIKSAYKEVDYEVRRGNATQKEKLALDRLVVESLIKHEKGIKNFNKVLTDLGATSYQVGKRVQDGFSTLHESVDKTTKAINEMERVQRITNPAMISFNQIVQDSPFGIRGMGNNIQFLTQQFTQLRAGGTSTKDILTGMMNNAMSPMGAMMLATSVITSGLTYYFDRFGKKTKEAKKEVEDLGSALEDVKTKMREMLSDARLLFPKSGGTSGAIVSADKSIADAYLEMVKYSDKYREEKGESPVESITDLYGFTKDTEYGVLVKKYNDAKAIREKITKQLNENASFMRFVSDLARAGKPENIEKLLRSNEYSENYISAFSEHMENVVKETPKINKNYKIYKSILDILIKIKNEEKDAKKAIKESDEFEKWRLSVGSQGQLSDEDIAEMDRDIKHRIDMSIRTAFRKKSKPMSEKEKMEASLKEQQEAMRDAMNMYNSLFFDPLRAGFDAVINKSQSFADAFISAIKKMIIQLLEFAVVASILSIIFPSAGNFMDFFGQVSGLSQKMPTKVEPTKRLNGGFINEPVFGIGKSGRSYTFAEDGRPEYVVSNKNIGNMNGMNGRQVIEVVGETKIKNDHILVSFHRANSKRNVVKA